MPCSRPYWQTFSPRVPDGSIVQNIAARQAEVMDCQKELQGLIPGVQSAVHGTVHLTPDAHFLEAFVLRIGVDTISE
jgi:hypothetical protein